MRTDNFDILVYMKFNTTTVLVAIIFAIGGFLAGVGISRMGSSPSTDSVAPKTETPPPSGSVQYPRTTTSVPRTTSQPIYSSTSGSAKFIPADAINYIHLSTPLPNIATIAPIRVTGEARGSWYTNQLFSVILKDYKGNVIASTQAAAVGNWLTEKFIPFETTVTFTTQPSGSRGTLVLGSNAPAGSPTAGMRVEIPVIFK